MFWLGKAASNHHCRDGTHERGAPWRTSRVRAPAKARLGQRATPRIRPQRREENNQRPAMTARPRKSLALLTGPRRRNDRTRRSVFSSSRSLRPSKARSYLGGLAASHLFWRSVRVRLGLRFSLGLRDRIFRHKRNHYLALRRASVVGIDVLARPDGCPVWHVPEILSAFPFGAVRVLIHRR
jgi:hypothetical protein